MKIVREFPSVSNRLFCLILSLVPIVILLKDFSTEYGMLKIPRFGEVFRSQAMDAVKQFAPPVKPNDVGYDGQFYAQIALDPTLRDPSLQRACDNLSYRAKRILMPAIAHVLGAGKPWYILQVYSLLNLAFWFLLLTILVRRFGVDTWRKRFLAIGILWNAGSLISIGRALTDLPAVCLGVLALCLQEVRTDLPSKQSHTNRGTWLLGSMAASLSVMTKETSVLSIFSFVGDVSRRRWIRIVVTTGIVLVPMSIWAIYVRHHIGIDATGMGNFTFPLVGFANKLDVEWRKAVSEFPLVPLLEMVAPWSIAVQAAFLLWKPGWRSPWWQFGIGFVFLAMMIGPWVWATQSAYSRCLLPLTVSFNVMLFQASISPNARWKWWIAGNIGFLDRAAMGIGLLFIVEFLLIQLGARTSRSYNTDHDLNVPNPQSR